MTSQRLTRAQWGAIPVDPERRTIVRTTDGTALHWVGPGTWGTAGPAGRHSLCAGKVRGIQRGHMAGEWYDIAYSEVVCPHGTRFEGRGHHVQTGANGSSAGNRSHYAVLALVGEGDPQPLELVLALLDAFEDYRARAGAGPDTTTHRDILKRHTGRITECPGDKLATLERFGAFMHHPHTPPVTETTYRKGTTMLVKVKDRPEVWVTDGMTRRHLPNPTALADYRATLKAAGAPASALEPHVVPTEARAMAAYGPVVK